MLAASVQDLIFVSGIDDIQKKIQLETKVPIKDHEKKRKDLSYIAEVHR